MTQGQQLSKRFDDCLLSGNWVTNTNFKEILEDVEFKEATTPYKSLNTIAVLTFHINYYMDGVLQVFRGGDLTIRDKYSFDMEPLINEKEWFDLKKRLLKNAEEFSDYLSKLTDDQIESHFVDEKYGNYRRNMNGMIEHCYYHLGQIVLIKKLLRNQ